MYNFKELVFTGLYCCQCVSTLSSFVPFNFKRALVVSKMTKYELEQYHNPHLDTGQLEKWLKQRGDYVYLVFYLEYILVCFLGHLL